MSVVARTAAYATPVIISGVVVAAGYYSYKYFQNKRCIQETDSDRFSGSFYTGVDYQSDNEYSDAKEEWPDDLEKDQLFELVDKLMLGDENGRELAYLKMQEAFENMSEDPNFLWRYAKLLHLKGKVNNEKEAWKFIAEGLKCAEKAVKNDPKNPEAHKWFAILTGRGAEFLSGSTKKAEKALIFFDHIQEALKLRPKDWELHHLLGVFEYKLASLNYLEKIFARGIFKGKSKCEYWVAKNHFKTADEYNPNSSKDTKLFLAKCLYQEKKLNEAFKCLCEASEIQVQSADDKACDKEIKQMIDVLLSEGVNPFS